MWRKSITRVAPDKLSKTDWVFMLSDNSVIILDQILEYKRKEPRGRYKLMGWWSYRRFILPEPNSLRYSKPPKDVQEAILAEAAKALHFIQEMES